MEGFSVSQVAELQLAALAVFAQLRMGSEKRIQILAVLLLYISLKCRLSSDSVMRAARSSLSSLVSTLLIVVTARNDFLL